MFLVSSCSCLCPIQRSQLLSREWRCSWSNADRRSSICIWEIDNIIAYWGASYIRDLTVFNSIQFHYARYYCVPCQISKWFNSTLLDTISYSAKFPNDSTILYEPDIIAFCVKFPNNFVGGWNGYFTVDLPHYSRLLVFAFQSCWLCRRE